MCAIGDFLTATVINVSSMKINQLIIKKIAKVFVNLLEQINYYKHFRYDDRQRQNYGNFLYGG